MTVEDLFPGKMGKVELTRVAIRLRMPALMRMQATDTLEDDAVAKIKNALEEVRKG